MAAVAILLLIRPVCLVGMWIERPNEGWNAIHALDAFGPMLYPAPNRLLINNYLPGWFYLVGLLSHFGADPIVSGRIIALGAFVAVASGVFCLLRCLCCSVLASVVGALCFMLIVGGLLSSYVGLAEPQMLAHALAIWGAVLLLSSKTPGSVVAASIVTVLALFTKQTVIALPMASFVWMAMYRRQWAQLWLSGVTVAACVAWMALIAGYGSDFIANVFFARTFALASLLKNIALVSKVAVPLIFFLSVSRQLKKPLDKSMTFGWLAIVSGLLVITVFGGADGVSINIVIDLVIGCSVGLGAAWDNLRKLNLSAQRAKCIQIIVVISVLLRVGIGTPYAVFAFAFDSSVRAQLNEISASNASLRDKLVTLDDPVVCEALSVCLWAGHRSTADLWKLHYETTLTPYVDAQPVIRRLSEGKYGAVVLFGGSSPINDRHLPGLGAALANGYKAPQVFGSYEQLSLFLPK